MPHPLDQLAHRLEAARTAAERLARDGDVRFRPVADNLGELLALPRDDRFPIEVLRRRWERLPFDVDRPGSYSEELTPAMEELVARLVAVEPAAVAASPELQDQARRGRDPVAAVVTCHGHAVAVLKWGTVLVDAEWLMPQSSSGPARLFLAAPRPYLVGQTGASLWIMDLDRGAWSRLEVAPGSAGPHAFLDRLEVGRGRLEYDVPVLSIDPEPRIAWRRTEVSLDAIAWSPCPRPGADLLARCLRARWEAGAAGDPRPAPREPLAPTTDRGRGPGAGLVATWTSGWEDLRELLAAYFSDGSTSDGVAELVFLTAEHPEEHRRSLDTIELAFEGAAAGDAGVAAAIRASWAASPRDAEEARAYIEALRAEYLRQYELAVSIEIVDA